MAAIIAELSRYFQVGDEVVDQGTVGEAIVVEWITTCGGQSREQTGEKEKEELHIVRCNDTVE